MENYPKSLLGPAVTREQRRKNVTDRSATDVALEGLREQFPGVPLWFGQHTGSWWALVSLHGETQLIEAVNPSRLREAISNVKGRPWSW